MRIGVVKWPTLFQYWLVCASCSTMACVIATVKDSVNCQVTKRKLEWLLTHSFMIRRIL